MSIENESQFCEDDPEKGHVYWVRSRVEGERVDSSTLRSVQEQSSREPRADLTWHMAQLEIPKNVSSTDSKKSCVRLLLCLRASKPLLVVII